jgi:hypothetical protein
MNRDDIVRWAREAGFEADESVRDVWATDGYWAEELEHFANLVAAAAREEEREACANLIQDLSDRRVPASEYADAICARSWK